jgi:hypothetical protein
VAVSACRRFGAGRVLVVTPAVVRDHWLDEFSDWWPDHPQVGLITMGRARKSGVSKKAAVVREQAYQSSIQVVSYALLGEVDPGPWDAIILDEAHRLKSVSAKQSKLARHIIEANPRAMVLPLTATPMPDDIIDIWNINDMLWPGRFGRQTDPKYVPWPFANRYAVWNYTWEDKGEFKGLNPAHADELRARLNECWSRVTKAEVAHLLPPFMVRLIKVAADRQVKFKNVDDWLDRQGTEKLPFVKEWLEDAVVTDNHLCILTHLRATAESIAAQAAKDHPGLPVFCITGDEQPGVRVERIKLASQHKKAIVVATMHSVGIGIDGLSCFTRGLFAELYWRFETMQQAMGRLNRLSSQQKSQFDILCLKGTQDEAIARSLMKKINAIDQAIGAGKDGVAAMEALDGLKMTDEEAVAMLNEALFANNNSFMEVF